MRNFTDNNRMTGVGNALKRLYQRYLVEYEQARPRTGGPRGVPRQGVNSGAQRVRAK
jgi:hypothetical protein